MLQAQWSPPRAPEPPPYQPTALEQAFGYGASSIVTLEAHYNCTFPIHDADGWTACLSWDGGAPSPILSQVRAAQAATKTGDCILGVQDHRGEPMCVAWKR